MKLIIATFTLLLSISSHAQIFSSGSPTLRAHRVAFLRASIYKAWRLQLDSSSLACQRTVVNDEGVYTCNFLTQVGLCSVVSSIPPLPGPVIQIHYATDCGEGRVRTFRQSYRVQDASPKFSNTCPSDGCRNVWGHSF